MTDVRELKGALGPANRLAGITKLLLEQIDQETDDEVIFRLRAAVAALAGDLKGVEQCLAASKRNL